jgi:microcystin-dependent protein
MATYTDANAIKKIGTGDEAGTWGTSTNNNFDIIDRAANGFVSIALSGTSYTLALSTTAVLSNGHYKAIKFTGSPGGTCTVTLEQNDRARMYMILNSTDQALVITQGSGGNTTIATGKSAIVLADGAGAGAAVTDYTSTLSNLQGPAISSPTMTGSPTAPTPSAGTNNTLLATTAFVATAISNTIPSGVILLWSGAISAIPTGWVLCDGTNSTPDLRDRFVVGADADSGGDYDVNATGGSANVTLTTSQIPSHSHANTASSSSTSSVTDPGHNHYLRVQGGSNQQDYLISLGEPGTQPKAFSNSTDLIQNSTTGISVSTSTTTTMTNASTGGGSSHENRPPYYALAYIMKT